MRRILLTYLLIFSVVGYAQRRYAADRYFKEFAYKKSAELYKVLYDKGDDSQLIISRLGDSYYYNIDPISAEKWYKLLLDKYENSVSPEYIFRYAQVLKSNGKIKESDAWLRKLKEVKGEDSRALALDKNEDYFVEYSNKKKTFVSLKNLKINTKYSDFGGFIHDNKLYFASTRPDGGKFDKKLYRWNNQPYLNIYTADENFNDNDIEKGLMVDNAEKLTAINTRYHESNIIFTKDGKTMYFTRDNYNGDELKGDKNKVTHLKIYKATLENGKWGKVEELPFNNDNYSIGHPALSPDEKTLYFVSDKPGGLGATDLYKVALNSDGSYGAVENLGDIINTEGREMFPYLDQEGTLYFASDGHLGLGALDVFETKEVEDNFTKPINLGTPVNGPLDDFAFVISDDKSYGYFSSNRKGGKGDDDIYSYVIYRCKEDIIGVVTDSETGKPISGAVVRLIDGNGVPVSKQTTGADGKYAFKEIACENNFTVSATKDDYRNDQKTAVTEDINKKIINTDLALESLIVDTPETTAQIVIKPIYFDFDLYTIREDAEYELEHIVSVMKNNPDMVIRIESHTDSRGPSAYNRFLSDKRAKATRDYIVSRGIAPERIASAIGYGEDQLLNNCNDANQRKCTEAQHQQNRRSYFYIVKKGENQKRDEAEMDIDQEQVYYTVIPKDTLFSISKRFGITVEKLKELNKLKSNEIIIGQKLKVK
ncbi:OmpA family protein [Tenacibaculum amylolyticum]|uniref:OmpA family protein n=1 Tax=Tenacibaculum amylolyticum TaxID=104269 RepID=UPI00389478DB